MNQYAGIKDCQFGEVGYAIIKTSDPTTSAKFIYGTVTGGCKTPMNYYALLGEMPASLTDKKCTDLAAKVRVRNLISLCTHQGNRDMPHLAFSQNKTHYTQILKCILTTNNDMDAFNDTYTACSVYESRKQSALAV